MIEVIVKEIHRYLPDPPATELIVVANDHIAVENERLQQTTNLWGYGIYECKMNRCFISGFRSRG
jgi:hypothetical protein